MGRGEEMGWRQGEGGGRQESEYEVGGVVDVTSSL